MECNPASWRSIDEYASVRESLCMWNPRGRSFLNLSMPFVPLHGFGKVPNSCEFVSPMANQDVPVLMVPIKHPSRRGDVRGTLPDQNIYIY